MTSCSGQVCWALTRVRDCQQPYKARIPAIYSGMSEMREKLPGSERSAGPAAKSPSKVQHQVLPASGCLDFTYGAHGLPVFRTVYMKNSMFLRNEAGCPEEKGDSSLVHW